MVDSQPRRISNLIVDQTASNPAAVAARRAPTSPTRPTTGTLSDPNVAPDAGLSAPFNSWFTLFGQFFDHGLDLVTKNGGHGLHASRLPTTRCSYPARRPNFMVLNRTTNQPGPTRSRYRGRRARGDEHDASFVDQNQTYTSHPSHQVFLREYALSRGKPVATAGSAC